VKLPAIAIQGKCEVRKKKDLPALDSTAILDHMFFCEHVYDPVNEPVKQMMTKFLSFF
jgi:DNA (cytosine-5)-methyltransferase 1